MKSFWYLLVLVCMLALPACTSFPIHTQLHTNNTSQFSTLADSAEPQSISAASEHNPYLHTNSPALDARLSMPVVPRSMILDPKEVTCMAMAIYFESNGEPEKGQIGVGYVIANRMSDSRFPSTACGVVHQGNVRNGHVVRGQCQFSWYCDGKPDTPSSATAYARDVELAKLVLLKIAPNPIGHCLFFHERHVKHAHARKYASTVRIANHFFYSYAPRVYRAHSSSRRVAAL